MILEHRRHSIRNNTHPHLSKIGIGLANQVGKNLDDFDYVFSSISTRAIETAVAMGYSITGTIDFTQASNNLAVEDEPLYFPVTFQEYSVAYKEEGYFYYWAIDREGMIEQMERAYYEKVNGDDGKPLTVPAGNGKTHYAMRIEQKYYDEDIEAQQKLNIDTSTKEAHALGDSEYVPDGSENVVQREREIV